MTSTEGLTHFDKETNQQYRADHRLKPLCLPNLLTKKVALIKLISRMHLSIGSTMNKTLQLINN